ncbi:uncharacterized protein UV8b_05737 [Ustilaginoidea virens]|uniref:Uncharacterized protein n=1 Tax=Ustilaginoidea virens TaxID=1159556 RepID=A0A8E5HUJ0_USTVR|nr:uncharacterized protein UV8b_05737 [Ustilaginoidea virens]QUC21494.1 hypothetical protein UV8b_05737 [Ustilaginoidea virens]
MSMQSGPVSGDWADALRRKLRAAEENLDASHLRAIGQHVELIIRQSTAAKRQLSEERAALERDRADVARERLELTDKEASLAERESTLAGERSMFESAWSDPNRNHLYGKVEQLKDAYTRGQGTIDAGLRAVSQARETIEVAVRSVGSTMEAAVKSNMADLRLHVGDCSDTVRAELRDNVEKILQAVSKLDECVASCADAETDNPVVDRLAEIADRQRLDGELARSAEEKLSSSLRSGFADQRNDAQAMARDIGRVRDLAASADEKIASASRAINTAGSLARSRLDSVSDAVKEQHDSLVEHARSLADRVVQEVRQDVSNGLAGFNLTIDELRRKLTAAEETHADQAQEIDGQAQEIAGQAQEISVQAQVIAGLSAELERHGRESAMIIRYSLHGKQALQDRVAQLEWQLGQMAAVEAVNDELTVQLDQARLEISDREGGAVQAAAQLDRLQVELDEALGREAAARDRASRAVADAAQSEADAAQGKADYRDLEAALGEALADQASSVNAMRLLQADLDAMRNRAAEVSRGRAQAEGRAEQAEAELAMLQDRVAEASRGRARAECRAERAEAELALLQDRLAGDRALVVYRPGQAAQAADAEAAGGVAAWTCQQHKRGLLGALHCLARRANELEAAANGASSIETAVGLLTEALQGRAESAIASAAETAIASIAETAIASAAESLLQDEIAGLRDAETNALNEADYLERALTVCQTHNSALELRAERLQKQLSEKAREEALAVQEARDAQYKMAFIQAQNNALASRIERQSQTIRSETVAAQEAREARDEMIGNLAIREVQMNQLLAQAREEAVAAQEAREARDEANRNLAIRETQMMQLQERAREEAVAAREAREAREARDEANRNLAIRETQVMQLQERAREEAVAAREAREARDKMGDELATCRAQIRALESRIEQLQQRLSDNTPSPPGTQTSNKRPRVETRADERQADQSLSNENELSRIYARLVGVARQLDIVTVSEDPKFDISTVAAFIALYLANDSSVTRFISFMRHGMFGSWFCLREVAQLERQSLHPNRRQQCLLHKRDRCLIVKVIQTEEGRKLDFCLLA